MKNTNKNMSRLLYCLDDNKQLVPAGIGLTNKGKPFYFDPEDIDVVLKHKWTLNNNGYVRATKKIDGHMKPVYLHREILKKYQDMEGLVSDHINHDKVDERKENLRACTIQENTFNKSKDNSIIGVNRYKKMWIARIQKDGVRTNLGYFEDKKSAIRARLEAEKELFGEFAPQKHLFAEFAV